ncbi:MAG: DUF4132 domain-containing protein [Saprospirales bacterium]|nr:MAG: DUF4132 domain-containing protein [Saprospirales bacterium]
MSENPVFLAHCCDLNSSGKWSDWQKYCYDNKIQQPFKQIFRELYLPTPDEEFKQTVSSRYSGYQLQTKKAVALFKTRGWTLDYEQGLQKVFHKQKIIAEVFAIADWFAPSEVEGPKLETIRFIDHNSYTDVPFRDVPPYIFSEVMRDIDLVVSVAFAAGVDPETSLSTIDLRRAIARESARLFKLKNVEFQDRHIIIEGHYTNYSLHLGSGVVHKRPGGFINIIPVHSSHRGRIFLPFMDEDPKTAEIVSKMLLLAEDKKLKDPTILTQIHN